MRIAVKYVVLQAFSIVIKEQHMACTFLFTQQQTCNKTIHDAHEQPTGISPPVKPVKNMQHIALELECVLTI